MPIRLHEIGRPRIISSGSGLLSYSPRGLLFRRQPLKDAAARRCREADDSLLQTRRAAAGRHANASGTAFDSFTEAAAAPQPPPL